MKKRLLSLFLSLVLTLGLLPVGALAENEINVTFSYSANSDLAVFVEELAVSAGLAAQYGIGEPTSTPTVLDAIVAAHKVEYGEAFTSETAATYVDDNFAKGFGNTGWGGHYVNHRMGMNGPSAEPLSDGDIVSTYLYAPDYTQRYIQFVSDGNGVTTLNMTTADTKELLVGEYVIDQWVPAANLSIVALDGTDMGVSTDENGAFSISFSETGTYWLTTTGTADGTTVVAPWCKIVVGEESVSQNAEMLAAALPLFNVNTITNRTDGTVADLANVTDNLDNLTVDWSAARQVDGYDAFIASYPDGESIDVAWTTTNSGIVNNGDGTLDVTATAADQRGNLTVTLTYDGETASANYPVTVKGLTPVLGDVDTLVTNITTNRVGQDGTWWAAYTSDSRWWNALAMDGLSQSVRQAIVNQTATTLGQGSPTSTDYLCAIFMLASQGYDPSQLYTPNRVHIDGVTALNAVDESSIYTVPYVLLALHATNSNGVLTAKEQSYIDLLAEQLPTSWANPWGASIDTGAAMMLALAPYQNENATVGGVVTPVTDVLDAGVEVLKTQLGSGGTYGNPGADTLAILALVALGIDPTGGDFTVEGANLVDGLLSYQTANQAGFESGWGEPGVYNEYATNQAFVALKAYQNFRDTGLATNPFDLPMEGLTTAQATGSGSGGTDTVSPVPPSDHKIHVTFQLRARGYTLATYYNVEVDEGSKVYHVIAKAFGDNGIVSQGLSNAYITSVTINGTTYTEFGDGPYAGWVFKVNGNMPMSSIAAEGVTDGGIVELYYTADYTDDEEVPYFPGGSGSGSTSTEELEDVTEEGNKSVAVFVDVAEDDWFFAGVKTVVELGLFCGSSDTTFAPNDVVTGQMVYTVLQRLSGEEIVDGEQWYDAGCQWAVDKGLALEGDPSETMTREELAIVLYTFAQGNCKAIDLSTYTDLDGLTPEGVQAVQWAVSTGIMTGNSATTFNPTGVTTRGELATVLMRYLSL